MGVVEIHPLSLSKEDDTNILITQLDGNISLSSSISSSNSSLVTTKSLSIPVRVSHRVACIQSDPRPAPVLKTIRRDNKVLQARSLPKLSLYNMRSLMPKCSSFGADMEDRLCSLSFLTEVWERLENKKHMQKIEELFELKGLKYISTPRSGTKRGGGAAIVANTDTFSLSRLNVPKPQCLEVVWGLLRPLEITGRITKIIVCCFYCPPSSTRKSLLVDHLTFTLQSLLNTFPDAGIIILEEAS